MAFKTPTEEMNVLLRKCGSTDFEVAHAAQHELAKALTLPLRKGVLKGDIVSGIFETVNFAPGTSTEFPLDFLSPGSEKDFIAYTIPNHGRIPEFHVEGDYVMVPTFDIGASIDTNLKYIRDARWDVVSRMREALEAAFIRKNNADGWHTILAAAAGRNLAVYDDAATAGLFTKRLVALMRGIMRRNAGGNSTSVNKGKLTDLYISPEGMSDILSWDLSQIDDMTRNRIFNTSAEDGETIMTIFGVRIHAIDELGVAQEFQTYYEGTLAGSMSGSKVEIVVGLDLSTNDSFVHPVRSDIEVFEDPTLHRQRRMGFYSWSEGGWGVLNSQRVLLGMF